MKNARLPPGVFRILIWADTQILARSAPGCKDDNTQFIEPSYGERLHTTARKELRKFWSDYRWWVTIASAVIAPILAQILRHGIHSVYGIRETIENGLIGLVISLVGTYLIAMRKGAEVLDLARDTESLTLRREVDRLTPPKRTPQQQHYYDQAKTALEELGENERIVLKHLKNHGKITLMAPPPGVGGPPSVQSPLPHGMSPKDAYESLESCVAKSLVSREYRDVTISPNHPHPNRYMDYHIAEGMKAGLEELLYSPAD